MSSGSRDRGQDWTGSLQNLSCLELELIVNCILQRKIKTCWPFKGLRAGVNLFTTQFLGRIHYVEFSFSWTSEVKIVNIQWKGKFKLIVDLSPVSVSVPDSKFSARPQFLVRGYKLSSHEKDVLQRKAKSFFLIIKWTGAGQSRGQSNLFYDQLLSLYYFPSVQFLLSVRQNFIWGFWYFAVPVRTTWQLFPLTNQAGSVGFQD